MMVQTREKGVLLARSLAGNKELQARLAGLGIEAQGVESIRFADPADWGAVDSALRNAHGFDWVVFTSPKGASSFLKRLQSLGMSARALGPKLAAIGPSTANVLSSAGLKVDFVPRTYLTSALAEELPEGSGRRVLLLRADIGEASLVTILRRRGFEVTGLAIYRTVSVSESADPTLLEGARLVVFASPSEVRGFRGRIRKVTFDQLTIGATAACIGPVTAKAARAAGFRSVCYPDVHTIEGLVGKVGELIGNA